jgi:hypothetical protein
LGGFFGGSNANGNATPSSSSRLRRPSTTASDISSLASGSTTNTSSYNDSMGPPPVPALMPKIRAGMTPEARTRHMPQPKPARREALSSASNQQNQNQAEGRVTTMRLVRTAQDDGEGDGLDVPMLSALGTRRMEEDHMDMGMEELQAGLEDVSLDAWDASRGQDETVLVTIRYVLVEDR